MERMTGGQWSEVENAFAALLALTPEERARGLAAIPDDEVRLEVEALLRHASDDSVLTNVIGAMAVRVDAPDFLDRRVGPWKIVRSIGQGGQGFVYEALRADGAFHQRVAIKMLQWTADSAEARTQFRRERQILAGLEHPGIARLLDGGETEEGLPYLVMEFVEGEWLTKAVRDWPQRRKLELFIEIAGAVAYAHHKLIVHRDLKPANILVTPGGAAKLLDFGVAKLVDSDAQRTLTMRAALTPEYASPEQVRGDAITTACDIYSLGVVLYELLTGRRPYAFSTSSPVEIHREVCLTDPPKPGVSEDLDNIILMAMRKEPERRYRTVEEFAQDIRLSLDHRPVQARRDTWGYRLSRYVRRNWGGLAAAAAVAVAIAVGTISAVHSARIAQQRFDQVRRLAHSFVFDYNDDLARIEGTTQVREKMVRTALAYVDNLSKSAGGDTGLQQELAAAYEKIANAQGYPTIPNLGHPEQAVAGYRRAETIHLQIAARDPAHYRDTGLFYTDFAKLLSLTGNLAEAGRLGRESLRYLNLAGTTGPAPARPADLSHAWCVLADIDESSNRVRASYPEFRQCYEFARQAPHDTPGALRSEAGALEGLGTSAGGTGHLPEAFRAFDEAEKIVGQLVLKEPRNPAWRRNVALLAQFRAVFFYNDENPSMDDPRAAIPYSQQYLDGARRLLANDENDVSARTSYAIALFALSAPLKEVDAPSAVKCARESVQVFEQLIAGGKSGFLIVSRRARALRHLSDALIAAGQPAQARPFANQSVIEQRRIVARDKSDTEAQLMLAFALLSLARAEDALGATPPAGTALLEAEAAAKAAFLKDPGELNSVVTLSRIRRQLSEHYRRAGNSPEGRRWLDQAEILWTGFSDQNDYVRRKAREIHDESERLFQKKSGVA